MTQPLGPKKNHATSRAKKLLQAIPQAKKKSLNLSGQNKIKQHVKSKKNQVTG